MRHYKELGMRPKYIIRKQKQPMTKFQRVCKRLARSIFLQSFLLCTIAICVMGWLGATHEQTIIDFLMMFDNDFRYIP